MEKLNLEVIGAILALLAQAGIAVWWASGVNEKLDHGTLELIRLRHEVDQNTEFRIRWPRGEMGTLPDDVRQSAQIEMLHREIERLRK